MKNHYSPSDKYATTRAQREALWRLYRRQHPETGTISAKGDIVLISPLSPGYRAFRRRVVNDMICECLMLNIFGMWVGIEKDGYTHS